MLSLARHTKRLSLRAKFLHPKRFSSSETGFAPVHALGHTITRNETQLGLTHKFLRSQNSKNLEIDGLSLSVADVHSVANERVVPELSGTQDVRERLGRSVEWLERRLREGENDESKSIYGVTTGYGGSAYRRAKGNGELQIELIRHLHVGIGRALPEKFVRAAMLVRVNQLSRGASAIRASTLETLLKLLNSGVIPVVPERGSITASGDLVPNSHVAAVLMGMADAKATKNGETLEGPGGMKNIGMEPLELLPKEGLALVNGTNFAAAVASVTLMDAHVAAVLTQIATALTCEATEASEDPFDERIHLLQPHDGQKEVARNIRHLLEGSKLTCGSDWFTHFHPPLKQDRYPTRTAPQWIGPQLETLLEVTDRVTTELNSASDNPLFDVDNDGPMHNGNFQGAMVGTSMEQARLAIMSLGQIVFSQFSTIIDSNYSCGLPDDLADEAPGVYHSIKGSEMAMASYLTELETLAHPVTSHVHSAELNNQGINSVALISARKTAEALEILQLMLAKHITVLCHAIDLRFQEELLAKAAMKAIEQTLSEFHKSHPDTVDNSARDEVQTTLLRTCANMRPYHYALSEDGHSELAFKLSHQLSDSSDLNHDLRQEHRQHFKDTLCTHLQENMSEARNYDSASHKLGATRPIYNFLRKNLDIEPRDLKQGMTPSAHFQKTFDAINSGDIVKPMMECFEEESEHLRMHLLEY